MIYVFWGSKGGHLSYHGSAANDFDLDGAIMRYERILSEQLHGGSPIPERMVFFRIVPESGVIEAVECEVQPKVVLLKITIGEPEEAADVRAAHDAET